MPHPLQRLIRRILLPLGILSAVLATTAATSLTPTYSGNGWKAETGDNIYSLSPEPYTIVFADTTARTKLTPYLTKPAAQVTTDVGVPITVSTTIDTTPDTACPDFHQYHLEDMGRVRNRKVCELEDREVTNAEIGKGYEYAKDQIVQITDEELRDLPLPTAKAIEIDAFVPADRIDPIQIAEGYYLAPDGQVAAKPYKLLRLALERQEKVAIVKYAWSGRERLGMLRVRGDVIVLNALRWPDEIRDPTELLPPPVDVPEDEVEGALALVEMMSRDDLDDPDFRDTYTEAIAKVIEAKREDKPLPAAPEPEKPAQVLDLMAALTESVQKAKASRGEDSDMHEAPDPKKRKAKKQPNRKQAARKPKSA